VIPGRDDAENYRKLLAAMEILDFKREEQGTVQKILASVLHTGNVYYNAVHVSLLLLLLLLLLSLLFLNSEFSIF
jgi:hypothetical protein